MGNEIDVCSKDDEIDGWFWQHHGPKDETNYQFFQRSFSKLVDSVSNPTKMEYDRSFAENYLKKNGLDEKYDPVQFKVMSQDLQLHCCLWQRLHSKKTVPSCILYLHTNTRSIVDAQEIIPLADSLDCSILSFDLPGCGKSEGSLSARVENDIGHAIGWAKCILGDDTRFIMWARGMATAPAIHYLAGLADGSGASGKVSDRGSTNISKGIRDSFSRSRSRNNSGGIESEIQINQSKNGSSSSGCSIGSNSGNGSSAAVYNSQYEIDVVVLDSPFIGIEFMVNDAIDNFKSKGYMIPKSLLKVGTKMVTRSLKSRLGGVDPLSIRPLDHVHVCRVPCFVLSADGDDYIAVKNGEQIASLWGGPVVYTIFEGHQLDARKPEMVMSTLDFVRSFSDMKLAARTSSDARDARLTAEAALPEDVRARLSSQDKNVNVARSTSVGAGGAPGGTEGAENDINHRSGSFFHKMTSSISFSSSVASTKAASNSKRINAHNHSSGGIGGGSGSERERTNSVVSMTSEESAASSEHTAGSSSADELFFASCVGEEEVQLVLPADVAQYEDKSMEEMYGTPTATTTVTPTAAPTSAGIEARADAGADTAAAAAAAAAASTKTD